MRTPGRDDEGAWVQTAYSRVTVLTVDRTVDLALPSALPLADVLPQVMRYAAPEAGEEAPISWTLSRLGGTGMALSQTLAEAGVVDGEVLELRPETAEVRPVLVEDVRDAVEDRVDAAGGVWTTGTTGAFAVLAGTTVLVVLGLLAWVGRVGGPSAWADVAGPVPVVLVVAVLLFATWWSAWAGHDLGSQVAAAGAMAWGVLLGLSISSAADLDGSLALTVCASVVAAIAGVARLLTPRTTAHLAFAAVLLVTGAVEAAAATGLFPADQARRVVPVLALLTLGVLPRVSLTVGGLASADYRVRHVGRLDLATLRSRYRESNAILVGLVLGITVLVGWGSVAMLVAGTSWEQALAVAMGLVLTLRSRLFSRTQHMLAPRIGGLVVLTGAALSFALDRPELLPWVAAAFAGALAAWIGLASLPLSEIPRARVKRTLNLVEFLVVVVMLVLMFGALGVYDLLGGVFG